jgi:hypothetical protein
MRPPIFHTGFHKTGTTFLQYSFWPNVVGYTYSREDSSQIKDILLSPYSGYFSPDKAKQQIHDVCSGPFICSSEEFSTNPNLGGFNGLARIESYRRIAKVFPEAKLVVMIREQKEMIKSLYVQYVKLGGTATIHQLLDPHSRLRALNPGFSFEYYSYDKFIDEVLEYWPKEQVYLYNYDDLKANETSFLNKLSKDLDFTYELGVTDKEKSNVSMRYWTLKMLRILNRFSADLVIEKHYNFHIPFFFAASRKLMRFVDSHVPGNPKIQSEEILGADLCQYIDRFYERSNAQLLDKHGIQFKK